MKSPFTQAITLFVAPFFAAVSLAATPFKVEQVQAGLEVAISPSAPQRVAILAG